MIVIVSQNSLSNCPSLLVEIRNPPWTQEWERESQCALDMPHPKMARQLRNNQDLANFVVEGEAKGRQLETGSYGSVEEVSLVEHVILRNLMILCGRY